MDGFYRLRVLLAFILPFLGSLGGLHGQEVVHIGRYSFIPEQNIASESARVRGGAVSDSVPLGRAVGGKHHVLIQLRAVPSMKERAVLQAKGVELGDYLGGNAYWALVKEGLDARRELRGTGVTSVMVARGEWKVNPELWDGKVPAWARVGSDGADVLIFASGSVKPLEVEGDLRDLGVQKVSYAAGLRVARGVVPMSQLARLADLPWVVMVDVVPPPSRVRNGGGAILSRAHQLAKPNALGGRGLDGTGLNLGIWDGNVAVHGDYKGHVTIVEDENPSDADHGSHVAGTIVGSGLFNEQARGMAPGAHAYCHNFNVSSNGKYTFEEVEEAIGRWGIVLTQNSYGPSLRYFCDNLDALSYSGANVVYDLMNEEGLYPNVTHVFAAGNDQEECWQQLRERFPYSEKEGGAYGHICTRMKNSILVGAVDESSRLTEFTSFGPQDDGRLAPTVCAKGHYVNSTGVGSGYAEMSGTSMACPTTSGSLLLVMQRYRQLHGGKDMRSDLVRTLAANTARDKGRVGPDFRYGFGVLDVERMVEAVEQEQYLVHTYRDKPFTHTIVVPAGVKRVKVMLGWNDPSTRKNLKWGEKSLVHDLDLTVRAGGSELRPLFADPKHPYEVSTPRRDGLNNLEQCVVENPSGQLEVQVSAFKPLALGEQRFVVTWCFEYDRVRVVYPGRGDALDLNSDKGYTMILDGIDTHWTADLSYDGGKTFVEKAYVGPSGIVERVEMPPFSKVFKFESVTENAFLRLNLEDGRQVLSEPFTIAPRVEEVKLREDGGCAGATATLSWKEAPEAKLGYVVLRGDVNSGKWERVGTVAAGVTEYTVPSGEFRPGSVFSVAAVTGQGYGLKSEVVEASLPAALSLSADDLPFYESFVEGRHGRFSVHQGSNTMFAQKSLTLFPEIFPRGSNVLIFQAYNPSAVDAKQPFDKPEMVNRVAACDVEFRGMSDRSFKLKVMGLAQAEREAVYFRVKHGDQVLTDCSGRGVITTLKGEEQEIVAEYILKGDSKLPLTVEVVCANGEFTLRGGILDRFILVGITLEEVSTEPDVMVAFEGVRFPQDGPNLGQDSVWVRVSNQSGLKIERPVVELFRDNDPVGTSVIEALPPYGSTLVGFAVDLSTKEPLGQLFELKARCGLKDDPTPRNNERFRMVNSMGRVLPLGQAKIEQGLLGPVLHDPYVTYRLAKDERVIFTDGGGAKGRYSEKRNESTVKFLPHEPGNVVRARLVEFNTPHGEAGMVVVTDYVPEVWKWQDGKSQRVFQGDLSGDLPIEIVSEASDGGLTLNFVSSAAGEGFVILITEEPRMNPLSLVSANTRFRGRAGKVTAKVRNNFDVPVKDFAVCMRIGRFVKCAEVPLIAAKTEQEVEILEFREDDGLPIPFLLPADIFIGTDEDSEGGDNRIETVLHFDDYALPPTMHPAKAGAVKLGYLGDSVNFTLSKSMKERMQREVFYAFDSGDTIRVYTARGGDALHAKDLTLMEGYSAALWVDWDGDGKRFDAPMAGMIRGKGPKYAVVPSEESYLTLKGLTKDTKPGYRRARLIVAPDARVMDANFESVKGLDSARVYDFTLEVVAGDHPSSGDLALQSLAWGDGAGKPLGQSVELQGLPTQLSALVTVQNAGLTPVQGQVNLQLTCGNSKENVLLELTDPLPAKETRLLTIPLKELKIEAVGLHVLHGELEDFKPMPDAENNTAEGMVSVWARDAKRPYALHFSTLTDHTHGQAYLPKMPNVDGTTDKGWTLEFWLQPLKTAKPFVTVLTGDVAVLHVSNPAAGAPEESLFFATGNVAFHTEKWSVPYDQWTHVALVIEDVNAKNGGVKVYLNGVEQGQLTYLGEGIPSKGVGTLKVGSEYDGLVDEVRVWKMARTDVQVKEGLYRHIEASDAHTDQLVYQASFDEGVWSTHLGVAPSLVQESGYINVDKQPQRGIVWDSLVLDRYPENEFGIWFSEWEESQFLRFVADEVLSYDFTGSTAGHRVCNLYFKDGADLSQIKGVVKTVWPESAVTLGGLPFEANVTPLDFRDGKAVTLRIEKNVWGVTLVEEVELRAYSEEYAKSEIIRAVISPAKNAGLISEVEGKIEGNNVLFTLVKAPDNPRACVVNFTLSPGASLELMDGTRYKETEVTLDLHTPRRVRVVAGKGQNTKEYLVRLTVPQVIDWTLGKQEFPYSATPYKVEASVSSGRPILWLTSDGGVASVSDGKLLINSPGETTITATAPGDDVHQAAEPKSYKITVHPGDVTVVPVIEKNTVVFGDEITWHYDYKGFKVASDQYLLPDAQGVFEWQFVDAEGVKYDADGWVPVGEYRLEPKKKEVKTAKYTILAKELPGVKVVPSETLSDIRVRVLQAEGSTPVADALVELGGVAHRTNAQGVAYFAGRQNGNFVWRASCSGYESRDGKLQVTQPVQTFDVVLRTAPYKVTYTVSDAVMGYVAGKLEQEVSHGGRTEPVTAYRHSGYKFTGWDDGKPEALREDRDVQQSLSFKAEFEEVPVLLQYRIEGKGKFSAGVESEQRVKVGQKGTPVTVEPEEGYYFTGWADGVTGATRSDEAAQGKDVQEYVARFVPYLPVPHVETFADPSLLTAGHWSGNGRFTKDAGATSPVWLPTSGWEVVNGEYASGGKILQFIERSALGSVDRIPEAAKMVKVLYTPRYSLKDLQNQGVTVGHYYGTFMSFKHNELSMKLSYRVDDEVPPTEPAAQWKASSLLYDKEGEVALVKGDVEAAELQGRQWIQFRLEVEAIESSAREFMLAMDNFFVRPQGQQFTVSYSSIPQNAQGASIAKVKAWDINGKSMNDDLTEIILGYGEATPLVKVGLKDGESYKWDAWAHGEVNDSLESVTVRGDTKWVARYLTPDQLKVQVGVFPALAGTVESEGKAVTEVVGKLGGTCTLRAKAQPGYAFAYWSPVNVSTEELTLPLDGKVRFVKAVYRELEVGMLNVEVTGDGKLPDIDGNLVPVSGALHGVQVEVMRVDAAGNSTVALDRTEGKGKCSFTLPKARYAVRVSCPYFVAQRQEVELQPGSVPTTLQFHLTQHELFTLTVLAKNGAGEPLENAKVKVEGQESTTNSEGKALLHLPYGAYALQVSCMGYLPYQSVREMPLRDNGVEVTLQEGVEVRFRVMVKQEPNVPVEGAEVLINGDRFVTDADGLARCFVPKRPTGYDYNVSCAGYAPCPSASPLVVDGGQVPEQIIQLEQYRSDVMLLVLDYKTKAPIPGAKVQFLDGVRTGGVTDADGKITFNLPPGDHPVRVDCNGYEYVWKVTLSVEALTAHSSQQLTIHMVPKRNPNSVEHDAVLDGVVLAPNPVVSTLVLSNLEGVDRVELYTLFGSMLRAEEVQGARSLIWNLEGLPSGFYLVRCVRGEAIKTFKLVKQ